MIIIIIIIIIVSIIIVIIIIVVKEVTIEEMYHKKSADSDDAEAAFDLAALYQVSVYCNFFLFLSIYYSLLSFPCLQLQVILFLIMYHNFIVIYYCFRVNSNSHHCDDW